MRIRTIKPDFFSHEGLYDLEQATKLPVRLAYVGLWCAVDREGRFKWEPRRLGTKILPYDGIEFSKVLDALASAGFIVKYRIGVEIFGCVPSFVRHQCPNIREGQSLLPPPEEGVKISVSCTHDTSTVHAPCGNNTRIGDAPAKDGNGQVQAETSDSEAKTEEPAKTGADTTGQTQDAEKQDVTTRTCTHDTSTVRASGEGEGKGRGKDIPDADASGARDGDGNGSEPPRTPTEPPAKRIETIGTEHARFIALWTAEYPAHHDGGDYKFGQGKDGSAVKALLKTGKTVDELMRIAIHAWKHPDQFNCKQAVTIAGFNSRFNEIRQELNELRGKNKKGGQKEGLKAKVAEL